jgi:hypothetical protein
MATMTDFAINQWYRYIEMDTVIYTELYQYRLQALIMIQ